MDPAAPSAPGARVPAALDLTPGEAVQSRIYSLPELDPRHAIVGMNDRDPRLHDVYRIDLENGARELVLENRADVSEWTMDLAGRVRLGHRQRPDGGWEILRVDRDRLVTILTCGPDEEIQPLRFHVDGARAYVEQALADIEDKLPGMVRYLDATEPGMHTTDTIDFEVVLDGTIVLELGDGAEVALHPGDTIVQNGTRHRWKNVGDKPARLALFICGAVHSAVPAS